MKSKFYDILQKLGFLFLLNIAVILIYLLVAIFFKIPVMREIADRLFDKSLFEKTLFAIYGVSYYVILALAIFKNTSAKRAFLNATAESGYTPGDGVTDYLGNYCTGDIVAAFIMSVISFALLGVAGDFGLIRIAFLPQLAFEVFFGIRGACLIYPLVTLALNFAFTISAQYIWDKNRLGDRRDS